MTGDMARVAEALRAFEKGEIVVVVDDDDRENEGDLIVAAVHATPEKLAFIVRHTSGIVCAPMTQEEAQRLHLDQMVANNDAPHATAFTVSVDYKHGTTTGISAEERCTTVRALANPNAGPTDFVRPGHIFPLLAKDGGVLMRSGHTEAAVDLCKLVGLPPVGVICEMVNDDGTVKRGEDVTKFAEEHNLKMVSVADLIAWRQRQENFVERVSQFEVETAAGPAKAITYRTPFDPMQHLAVIWGDIRDGVDIPVRLHLESVIDDVFGVNSHIDNVIERLASEKRGVMIYLREGAVGVASGAMRPRDDAGGEKEAHGSVLAREEEWREIGLGAQILKDLGVSSIRLLSSKERHYVGLEGFGLEITATDIID